MKVVNKFLFGLCQKQNRNSLKEFLLFVPNEIVEKLRKRVLDKLNDLEDSTKWHFHDWQTLLTWVHKINDDFFSHNVAEKLPDIVFMRKSPFNGHPHSATSFQHA